MITKQGVGLRKHFFACVGSADEDFAGAGALADDVEARDEAVGRYAASVDVEVVGVSAIGLNG